MSAKLAPAHLGNDDITNSTSKWLWSHHQMSAWEPPICSLKQSPCPYMVIAGLPPWDWFCLFALYLSVPPPPHPPVFRTSAHRLSQPPAPPPVSPIPGDELMHMNGCPLIDSLCHTQCLVMCHQSTLTGRFLVNYLLMVYGRRRDAGAPPPAHRGVITAPFPFTHTSLLPVPYVRGTYTLASTRTHFLYYPCRPQFPSQSVQAPTAAIKYLSWIHERSSLKSMGFIILHLTKDKVNNRLELLSFLSLLPYRSCWFSCKNCAF